MIIGRKGPEAPDPPYEEPNSYASRALARGVYAYSEGPVVGVTSLKQVFFDETPVQAADDSYNFKEVEWDERTGLASQDYMPGFPDVEANFDVSTQVQNGGDAEGNAVVRSTSGPDVDRMLITVAIGPLFYRDTTTGDITRTSVTIRIDVRPDGGSWQTARTETVNEKNVQPFEIDYEVSKPQAETTDEWDVRVVRLTADSVDSNLGNDTYFSRYTEIIDYHYSYDNTALIGLGIYADIVGNRFPAIGIEAQGLICQIPSNYDPDTRTYTGTWDGTWSTGYTDNQAFILYTILLNERYGAGQYLDTGYIDAAAFYSAGRWNDAVNSSGTYVGVDDGDGGVEPRFTLNYQFINAEPGWQFLQTIAGTMRAALVDMGGIITLVQDRKGRTVQKLVTNQSIEGSFRYTANDIEERFNRVVVTWNDPAEKYRQRTVHEQDDTHIAVYGLNETHLALIGCTTEGQARRQAKAYLHGFLNETETCSFTTSLHHSDIIPGDIISTWDEEYTSLKQSGRVATGSTTVLLKLDRETTLASGQSYKMIINLSTGVQEERDVMEGAGDYTELTPTSPFSETPTVAADYAIYGTVEPRTWIVLDKVESEPAKYDFTCLEHNESKYDAIESGIALEVPEFTAADPYGTVSSPTNVQHFPRGRNEPDGSSNVYRALETTWDYAIGENIVMFEFRWNRGSEGWNTSNVITTPNYTIPNALPGTYDFQVFAINVAGRRSAPTLSSYTLETDGVSTLTQPQNVEVKGGGTTWYDSTATIVWDDFGDQTDDGEIFWRSKIEWWDNDTVTLLKTDYTYDLFEAKFTPSDQILTGSYHRNLLVKVSFQDQFRNETAQTSEVVSNPAPPVPDSVVLTTGYESVFVEIEGPAGHPDIVGYEVHRSTSSGFTPSPSTLVAEGDARLYNVPTSSGTVYYWRVGAYDRLGKDTINYSSAQASSAKPVYQDIDAVSFAFEGLQMYPDTPTDDYIQWSDFTAVVSRAGTVSTYAVSSDSAEWTSGKLYLYYVEGDSTMSTSTTRLDAFGYDRRLLGIYEGGSTFKFIEGLATFDAADVIVPGSVTASIVAATNVITSSAQIANLVVQDASIESVGADKIVSLDLAAINANLGTITAGLLQSSDGTMSIDLDDKEIIIAGENGQASDDYIIITDGRIDAYKYLNGQHVEFKSLYHIEVGQATNGETVTIPGYFENEPQIRVSPLNLQTYDATYTAQDQSLVFQIENLQETSAGSHQWQFDAVATLTLAGASGNTVVNWDSGSTSTATVNSDVQVTPANCDSITAFIRVKSQRSTGTSPNWYYRKCVWRIGYRPHSGGAYSYTGTRTVYMGAQFDYVSDSLTVALSADEWDFYVEYVFSDDSGSFSSGGTTYEYDVDVQSNGTPASSGVADTTCTYPTNCDDISKGYMDLGAYSPPGGWSIYDLDYTVNWAYDQNFLNRKVTNYAWWFLSDSSTAETNQIKSVINADPSSCGGGNVNMTDSGTLNVSNFDIPNYHRYIVLKAASSVNHVCGIGVTAEGDAETTVSSASCTIGIRRPAVISTTAANRALLDSYNFELGTAQQLAEGSLNWMAIGD